VRRQLAGSEAELEGMLRLSSSHWLGTFMLGIPAVGAAWRFSCI
jgi:hypothetical protein